LEKTFAVLNRLVKEGVLEQYAIGGAMGAMFYIEPVSTFDLDIFVILPTLSSGLITLSPLYEYLSTLGYASEGEYVNIEGVPVQFLPAYNDLVETALTEAEINKYGNESVRVFSVEYLIAISIQTGRNKDRARVEMLIEEATVNMEKLSGILERFSLSEKAKQWL